MYRNGEGSGPARIKILPEHFHQSICEIRKIRSRGLSHHHKEIELQRLRTCKIYSRPLH